MTISALILSGGESSRFQGTPKALLPVGAESSVRRVAGLCLAQGFDPVAVVVGPHRGPIVHELRGLPVQTVDSDHWFEGRTASVQSGLSALPEGQDLLFWPIDHPFVATSTVETLLAAHAADLLAVWFVPTFEGRGGHPVLWRSVVRRNVLELRPDAPLRSLLPEFGPQVRRIPVGDPGVVAAVDTPEAYREGLAAWMRREAA